MRDAIAGGTYLPGSVIPKGFELIERHDVSRETVRRAVAQLTAEGLLQPVRRRGTVVRARPPRVRMSRSRRVYKDEIGYYFDPTAQPWRALRTPTMEWGPCPYDVASLLQVDPGDEVLTPRPPTTSRATGRPLEVNDTRLDAERFEVGYPITRDASAE